MTIWTNEINELDTLYQSFKGHLPDIVKEMEQLIRTDDANVVMLYSRRCLEVIITDLCEVELKRPRKTEPLKGIIDKLNSEEKVPSHIITSMQSLNSMATYGTHPKDFDPEQVKPVLMNLAIIIRWYLKYKDFQIISKTKPEEEMPVSKSQDDSEKVTPKPKKRKILLYSGLMLGIVIIAFVVLNFIVAKIKNRKENIDFGNNKIYEEVKIGNQVWMAENLTTTLFNDGTPIPQVKNKTIWSNLKTPAYCWYDNHYAPDKLTYEPLYNWYAVNTGKLCRTGWHVASDAEWTAMITYLGGSQEAGGLLKDNGSAYSWLSPNLGATNKTGFTALAGGYREVYTPDSYLSSRNGSFGGIGTGGFWWSATEADDTNSWRYGMFYDLSIVSREYECKENGFSVRCVYDLPCVADYDNNYYKTIRIGSQIWMAENLKTTRFSDGTSIPLVADKNEWAYLQTPAYCWYDNDEATNKAYYGALYNWYAVNSGKLCPTGWHVPSDAEWTNLTTYLGGESVAGDKLKEIFSLTIDGRTGFAALPGGRRIIGITSSDYLCIGETGSWWSSTEYSSEDAWFREMSTNSDDVNRNYIFKDWGNSVRCVKD